MNAFGGAGNLESFIIFVSYNSRLGFPYTKYDDHILWAGMCDLIFFGLPSGGRYVHLCNVVVCPVWQMIYVRIAGFSSTILVMAADGMRVN